MNSFKDMLFGTSSRVASTLGLPPIKTKRTTYGVNGTRGGPDAKGRAYRSYIAYEHAGPFYYQAGWLPNARPDMKVQHVHSFLHATKGWRTQRSPTITAKLPNVVRTRSYGPITGARFDHGRFVYPLCESKNGHGVQVLVPCVKNAHKAPRKEPVRAPLAA